MYIDTCIEPMGAPWNCGNVHLSERTNYYEREKVLGSCSTRSSSSGSPAPGTPTTPDSKFSSTARPGKTTQLVAVSATNGKPCMPLPGDEGNGPEDVVQDADGNGAKPLPLGVDLFQANENMAASGGAVDNGWLVEESEDRAPTAAAAALDGIDDAAVAAAAAAAVDLDGIGDGAVAAAAVVVNGFDDTAVAADVVEGSSGRSSSSIMGGLPTAVLVSGANPGMVQHFVKAALWKMAEDCGMATGEEQRLLMGLLTAARSRCILYLTMQKVVVQHAELDSYLKTAC
jgi:hypothetical protein